MKIGCGPSLYKRTRPFFSSGNMLPTSPNRRTPRTTFLSPTRRRSHCVDGFLIGAFPKTVQSCRRLRERAGQTAARSGRRPLHKELRERRKNFGDLVIFVANNCTGTPVEPSRGLTFFLDLLRPVGLFQTKSSLILTFLEAVLIGDKSLIEGAAHLWRASDR